MQLDTRRIQTTAIGNTVVSFEVLCDGVVVDNVPTQALAWQRQDALRSKRPAADKLAEQMYSGE